MAFQSIITSVWTNHSGDEYFQMRLSKMAAFTINFDGAFATKITKDAKVSRYVDFIHKVEPSLSRAFNRAFTCSHLIQKYNVS